MFPSATKPVRSRKSLLVVLVAGLLVIGVAALWVRLTFSHPIGSGPAGPRIDPSAFTHPWTSRPVLFLGMGDSVTAGFGARRGYSYFDRVFANPADEFADVRGACLSAVFPQLQKTNLAVSGAFRTNWLADNWINSRAPARRLLVGSSSLPGATISFTITVERRLESKPRTVLPGKRPGRGLRTSKGAWTGW
jgi:hypothetical protein